MQNIMCASTVYTYSSIHTCKTSVRLRANYTNIHLYNNYNYIHEQNNNDHTVVSDSRTLSSMYHQFFYNSYAVF
jgi:hypothetical protein